MTQTERTVRWAPLAALLLFSSCAVGGQASVDDQKIKVALDLLNRVDEVLSMNRGTEIIKARTAELERLPKIECQGLISSKFRLETARMSNRAFIDAELAMSKVRLLAAERRAAHEDLESTRPEDIQPGHTAGEAVALVLAAFKAQSSALSDREYLSQLVDAGRIADDCKTKEYIAAEYQNEIAANAASVALLTSQALRLRALMQRPEFLDVVAAQANFDSILKDELQRNPEAAKARARVEVLQKSAETPDLQKSRSALNTAIRSVSRGL